MEIAQTLQYGLRGLGYAAAIVENTADPLVKNIILGAHLLPPQDINALPAGTIIYNLEQLGANDWPEHYYDRASKHQIWDYSPLNIAKWKERGCLYEPQLVEIGYVPELSKIVPAPQQDIDILFYGAVNEHRRGVLRRLHESGANVQAVFGIYGRQRDALIARSKIVINIHQHQTNLFEQVRVSYLLANSKAVVSETSPDIGEFAQAVAAFPYEQLVDGCLELLRDDARRKELETRGFEFLSRRNASQILSRVLLKTPPQTALQREQDLRRLYLDMMQKCITNSIYEDSNQDRGSYYHHGQLAERGGDWPSQAHSMIGNLRMTNLRQITEFVVQHGIPGDLIETGVWRGGACIMMRAVLKAYGVEDRRVWVVDLFRRLPESDPDVAADEGDKRHAISGLAISLSEVQANFAKYGLLDDQVRFLKGWFSETLPTAPIEKLAVLRLDSDMYASTMDALNSLYHKVSEGGFIIVDDYGAVDGCREAVHDFRQRHGIDTPIQPIDGSGVFWRKTRPASAPIPQAVPQREAAPVI
jgi:hypothetical protein